MGNAQTEASKRWRAKSGKKHFDVIVDGDLLEKFNMWLQDNNITKAGWLTTKMQEELDKGV